MKKAIKAFVIIGALMLIFAGVTGFFRLVMPPEETAEKTQKQIVEEAKDPLKSIGSEPEYWQFPGTTGAFGRVFVERMIVSWFVIILLLIFAYLVRRKLSIHRPSRIQVAGEDILEGFNDICKETMGIENGKRIFPLVMTLFLFIILCNYIGIIPRVFHFIATVIAMFLSIYDSNIVWVREGLNFPSWLIRIPEGHWLGSLAGMPTFEEPTADLNTTLGCGIIVMFYVHYKAIQARGLKGYVKSYFEPIAFFMPLNIVGEIAKGVSLSFRLFGNIAGGAVVTLVLMTLLYQSGFLLHQTLAIYFVLQGFLGLLIGAVQAFVFSMLALTYTAVLVED